MPTLYLPSRWLITAADLSDDPDIFPFMLGQTFLQLKTPVWSTDVQTSVSGRERRRALWSFPKWRFKVGYEVMRDAPDKLELQKHYAFFNAHAGQFQEFFYYDRSDHTATNQLIGNGDGVTTAFQLTRTMASGGITFTEPVRGVSGSPSVYINGTLTTAYTVGAYGIITFTSPPAAAALITWTGSFFFLCRFEKDDLDAAQMMQGLWSNGGLDLLSVKP